ncbi:orotidine-5'-phosphate decarboxylase [Pelagirhabdus alkalitolerans]|uniref:Orotidine 5'-phosphate decarboxylase n=1 Tax=Pelagirhabdus alkalitolerans TaxID=1612202 RepID=A0A1G6H0T8_9BACI|nr:orotidine-5'-phosphate decarboxylase [Pelagirhabdus alkalitolerans]SDB87927.1 orotidine-5'-phosphate decarboxylase [Pelagirhabdus alkalitolerans]
MDRSIYLALDFEDWKTTDEFLKNNQLHDVPVKVGMELFYQEGPDVVRRLRDQGRDVFLDIKLHDIPTTIYKAMKNIAKLDVAVTNVHALGTGDMIRAAKEGLMDGSVSDTTPTLLAVTLLTSMDQRRLKEELKITDTVEQTAAHLAALAQRNGADGVVCSAHEVELIKQKTTPDFLAVTPGIRLENSHHHDQKRVATPKLAKTLGADALVIGRSITGSTNPKQAYQKAEMEWS